MLLTIIQEKIRASGPLTVQEYMQLCLQHPDHGYYRRAPAVGAEGDFITAPEISQIFGDLLGMWVADRMGQNLPPLAGGGRRGEISADSVSDGMIPPPTRPTSAFAEEVSLPAPASGRGFALVELGPGRGTLMADMLRIISSQGVTLGALPGQAPRLKIKPHLVESNTTLRDQQRQKLWRYEPEWHDSIATLPEDMPLVIIANEFFDALPIRQWVGAEERRVGLDAAGGLCFMPEGEVTREQCPQGEAVMAALARRIRAQGGALLAVDYGYDSRPSLPPLGGEVRWGGRNEGSETESSPSPQTKGGGGYCDTLQAVRNHQYTDPLTEPGAADLTAHVDFGALKAVAQAEGLYAHGPVEQGAFLQRLGGDLWLQKLLRKADTPEQRKTLEEGWLRLISPAQMGSLFKVMAFNMAPQPPAGF